MPNPLYDTLFAPLADRDPPLLILPDGASIRGAEFLAMVHRAGNALLAAGVGVGDRVAVQIEKSTMALAVYGAAVARGAIFLPLNTAYTPAEVAYFVENAQPKLLLADSSKVEGLRGIAQDNSARIETLNGDGGGSFASLCATQSDTCEIADRGAGDLAAFLYTSGTTGRSKGAMLSQDNLLSNAEVLAREWRFGPSDVLLHALPIFHTHGLFVATNVALLTGGSMIFLSGFRQDEVIAALPKATAMMGVPTFYTRLLDDTRFTRDLCANMRLFVSGSAPLLAETHVAFEARTGHRILERYGMTETNMNTSNPYDGERKAGTVGRPLPGVELKITDPETGATLPRGEIGVIEVRGRNVFQGYWQMPEKTREELRDDGFFITGDLGVEDEDGYVTIVGRQKDLIISGGFNVYPKEVELILDDLGGVLESAVIGVPHPDFGEAVMAVLVPQVGVTLDIAAVEAALGGALARYKQPKAYVVLPELPRNTMGKVQKAALRRDYAAQFS